MDRIKQKLQTPEFQLRAAILLIFFSLVLSVLIYKKDLGRLFIKVEPFDLGSKPAVVLFNRHTGCECILEYYDMAKDEVNAWLDTSPAAIQLIYIDLDVQPAYGVKYKIGFAPALLLLDANGEERWRQEGISSPDQVFDFEPLEKTLATLQ